MIFYSNDLDGTPTKIFYEGTEPEAIRLVRGLGPMHRWVGDEILHCTLFQVPVLIVAYNLFMGSVDIFDHCISINNIQRKEKRVSMTLFTYFISLCIHNSYSIYQWLQDHELCETLPKNITYGEFKRLVAEYFLNLGSIKKSSPAKETSTTKKNNTHRLVKMGKNTSNQSMKRYCYICSLFTEKKHRNNRKWTVYMCLECRVPVHPECNHILHNPQELNNWVESNKCFHLLRKFPPRKNLITDKEMETWGTQEKYHFHEFITKK